MEKYSIYWPEFYTATILEWKHLLKPDKYKHKIIETLQYLTSHEIITLYAFVIMSNHIHLIWQAFFAVVGMSIKPASNSAHAIVGLIDQQSKR